MKHLLLAVLGFGIMNAKSQSIINDISNPGFTLQDAIGDKLADLAVNNYIYLMADKDAQSSVYDIKKAKAAWLNQLSPSFNVNEFSIKSFGSSVAQVNNFFPRYNINLSLPLGMFSTRAADVKIARLKTEKANYQRESNLANLKQQIKTNYQTYLSGKYLLALQESLLQDEKILLDRVTGMFENNQVDLEVFTSASRKYNDLLVKKVNLLQTINTAIYNLEELLGMKLEDAINKVAPPSPSSN